MLAQLDLKSPQINHFDSRRSFCHPQVMPNVVTIDPRRPKTDTLNHEAPNVRCCWIVNDGQVKFAPYPYTMLDRLARTQAKSPKTVLNHFPAWLPRQLKRAKHPKRSCADSGCGGIARTQLA